jgi:hypothetical protein
MCTRKPRTLPRKWRRRRQRRRRKPSRLGTGRLTAQDKTLMASTIYQANCARQDLTLLPGGQPRLRPIFHWELFVAWKKRGKRRAERKYISTYLAASHARANGQVVESWEAGDSWTLTILKTSIRIERWRRATTGTGPKTKTSRMRILMISRTWTCKRKIHMPHMDDSDEDEEGGGAFGMSRDVAMVA